MVQLKLRLTIVAALIAALLGSALISCSNGDDDDDQADDDDASDDDDDDDDVEDPGDPIEPTEGYRARQAEYLAYCSENNGPGSGGIHGQPCRLEAGEETFNEDAIGNSCRKIDDREDCSDFDLNSILRLLYLDRDTPALSDETREQLEQTVLDFKYWLDEPGPDEMCWWSENHQILFHTAELLAGQLFPDRDFTNSGMTGEDHVEHAIPLLTRWLQMRGRIGFAEWHSNVYFNEDMPALVNLVDFAEDDAVALQAAMLLDLLAFDFANNYYKGLYATTHGRTYPDNQVGGQRDSTGEAAWIMLGLGDYSSGGNFAGAALATSGKYWPPAILEDVAADAADSNEARERDSIDVIDGPSYGVGYHSHEDVMFWWGLGAYAEHHVIMGTFQMVEDLDLWDGFLWSDLGFLRGLVGSPLLAVASEMFDELSRGPALETINTYTFRTPYYQLSGAQDYNKGLWGAQSHIWQATIDPDAIVFTTYPGGLEGDYMAGEWTGGWLPRAAMHENVAILQYHRRPIPVLDDLLFTNYTHAYFPKSAFDEVDQAGGWTFGKKGDAYVGLYSANPTHWAESGPEADYELMADGAGNAWICELGDADEYDNFESFKSEIGSADVNTADYTVAYESPSQGLITIGWEGPFIVDGEQVDLGPYPRWDNAYCLHEFDTNPTVITFGPQRLELDFEEITRKYWLD